jgi:hypothetical protein
MLNSLPLGRTQTRRSPQQPLKSGVLVVGTGVVVDVVVVVVVVDCVVCAPVVVGDAVVIVHG